VNQGEGAAMKTLAWVVVLVLLVLIYGAAILSD